MNVPNQLTPYEAVYAQPCAYHSRMERDVQMISQNSQQITQTIANWREEMLTEYVTKDDLAECFTNFANSLIVNHSYVTKKDLDDAFERFKTNLTDDLRKVSSANISKRSTEDHLWRMLEVLLAVLLAVLGVKYIPIP